MKRSIVFILAAAMLCVSCSNGGSASRLKDLFRGEVDTFKSDNGLKINIFSVKHGTTAIRIGDKWVYVDANTTGAEPATDYSAMPKADILLFTHNHEDHFDREAVSQLTGKNTMILCNGETKMSIGFGHVMRNGEHMFMNDGWEIEAVPAYNTSEEKLQFHPKGRDNGYIISVDGFRIYVAGDTENIPELSYVKDIDVAFLPCNLPYTMDPEQFAAAARTINPKVLFPYHYGETDMSKVQELLKGSGIDVRIRQYQ